MGLFSKDLPKGYPIEESTDKGQGGKTIYTLVRNGVPTQFSTFQRKLAVSHAYQMERWAK